LGFSRSYGWRRLSQWGVLVRIRDGLIIEPRSCLSENDLLADMGLH
jgi:hypothetical protein